MACSHETQSVPVTMGSPRFREADAGLFHCIHAWFPAGAWLEPHTHDRATFAVMLDGSFDLEFASPAIRRANLPCPPGTVFTEPAGEVHANRVGGKGATVMVLQVDPDGAGSAFDPLRPMLVDQINHFGSQRHGLLARRLLREIHEPDALSPLAIESLGFEMLVQAARRRGPAIERSTPGWLDLAEEYVRAHFRESIRIADVAEAAGVHPSHLAGVFRERHGVPLGTFIRRLRLEWAADELLRSEASIGSIAYAAGYCDQSHLTRAFGSYFGMTPGAYRRTRRRA